MDGIFRNAPARQALKALQKINLYPEKKSFVIILIQIDAVTIATVDSFKETASISVSRESHNNRRAMTVAECNERTSNGKMETIMP